MNYIFFILLGYLSGSVLYAYLIPRWFCQIDIMKDTNDHNPGTFNAFKKAGPQSRTPCDLPGTCKRISSGLSGIPHFRYNQPSVCICIVCTCCRTRISGISSKKRRKSDRRFFWSPVRIVSILSSGAAVGLFLFVVFILHCDPAAFVSEHHHVFAFFPYRNVFFSQYIPGHRLTADFLYCGL